MRPFDASELLIWYRANKRNLPWRTKVDAYAVIVSEFMLQQTTVAAVIPKYLAWMERFPDADALAEASNEEVMRMWSGLGYYQRARRLHSVAQEISALGYVPTELSALKALPGFGPYTAAAVASICFERPHLAIDTNVIRVLFRYYAIDEPAQRKEAHELLRKLVQPVLECCKPSEFNQALMELGASSCSVKHPACELCPLQTGCKVRTTSRRAEDFPRPTRRKQVLVTEGTCFVLEHARSAQVLLLKGTSLGLLKDLHQPPILFGNEASEHPISQALGQVLPLLADLPQASAWSLKYGISGRRLELQSLHWVLEGSLFSTVESRFADLSVETQRFSVGNGEGNQVPISTLTRKVLGKFQESLSASHSRDDKKPKFEL